MGIYNYRKIDTGLKTQLDADIIEAVFGQMSDGKWENSRAMEGYWPYIDVEKKGNKVFLLVNEAFQIQNYPINKFEDMPDDKVKIWVANHIKMVIKDEGLDWKRDNREETDYLATDWRTSKQSATVSDCYYVYEVLKGRNAARHAEYQRESMDVEEAKNILNENGYLVENTEADETALMQMEELIRVANVLHETIYAALDAGYIVKRTNPIGYFLQNPKTKNVFAVNLDAKNEGIFVNINKNSFEEFTKPSIAKATVDKILDWIEERDTDMRKE